MTDALYLIARIGTSWVALPTDHVEAVVRMPTVVPIPTAPTALSGIVAIRSRLLTLISPAAIVGEAVQAASLAVILSSDGHSYAVAVDAVDDVTTLSEAAAYPGDLSAGWAVLNPTMARHGDRIILIIDPDTLVSAVTRTCRRAA